MCVQTQNFDPDQCDECSGRDLSILFHHLLQFSSHVVCISFHRPRRLADRGSRIYLPHSRSLSLLATVLQLYCLTPLSKLFLIISGIFRLAVCSRKNSCYQNKAGATSSLESQRPMQDFCCCCDPLCHYSLFFLHQKTIYAGYFFNWPKC